MEPLKDDEVRPFIIDNFEGLCKEVVCSEFDCEWPTPLIDRVETGYMDLYASHRVRIHYIKERIKRLALKINE
jgi:hypothetical protein